MRQSRARCSTRCSIWYETYSLDGYIEVLYRVRNEQYVEVVLVILVESRQPFHRGEVGHINGPHLVALVRAGARFQAGKLIERSDQTPDKEASEDVTKVAA